MLQRKFVGIAQSGQYDRLRVQQARVGVRLEEEFQALLHKAFNAEL